MAKIARLVWRCSANTTRQKLSPRRRGAWRQRRLVAFNDNGKESTTRLADAVLAVDGNEDGEAKNDSFFGACVCGLFVHEVRYDMVGQA